MENETFDYAQKQAHALRSVEHLMEELRIARENVHSAKLRENTLNDLLAKVRTDAAEQIRQIKEEAVTKAAEVVERVMAEDFATLCKTLGLELQGAADAPTSFRIAETLKALAARAHGFDFRAHLQRQREFSEKTFGPNPRTAGVLDHIRKELAEIEADPLDLTEWIDVVILALDGAWRHGGTPELIIAALAAKQAKNEARTWPDWRAVSESEAICHVKGT